MVTLGELLELPALRGARLEGAPAAASREVRWLTTVHIRPARPQQLPTRAGELLLIPPASVAHPALGGRLTALLRQLLPLEPTALVLWEPVTAEAQALLAASGVPWLAVPATASPTAIEREVTRYIADRQAELQRLETAAYHELLGAVIHGRGLAALLTTLARLSDKAVALEDASHQLVRLERPASWDEPTRLPDAALESDALLNGADTARVRAWLASVPVSPTDPPTALFDLARPGWTRLVAPVQGVDGFAGLLSLISPREWFSPRDRLLLKRATAACELELAKQTAVQDAQEQSRDAFVASLLAGDLPESDVVEHRAARLGYRLGAAHNVLVLRPTAREPAAGAASERRLALLVAQGLGADAQGLPYRVADGMAVLVLAVERFGGAEALAAWATALHRQLAAAWSEGALSGGLGRVQPGLGGIRLAYQGALWALDLGERLFGAGQLTRLQDLGVYQLLVALQRSPALRDFYQELLGPLVEYDQRKGGDLLHTLEAYLNTQSSPSETAVRLHLHRNTVLYRLRRIRELLGRDLDDPEQRLALQLALRARRVLAAAADLPSG